MIRFFAIVGFAAAGLRRTIGSAVIDAIAVTWCRPFVRSVRKTFQRRVMPSPPRSTGRADAGAGNSSKRRRSKQVLWLLDEPVTRGVASAVWRGLRLRVQVGFSA